MICTTGLGTDHSCKVWMKLHQQFLKNSPDMLLGNSQKKPFIKGSKIIQPEK
jgi:hypothetical protein